MLSFPEFIRKDKNFNLQRNNIINLIDHTEFLETRKIQQMPVIKITKHSFYSYLFTQRDDEISYKLEKLKLQLIDHDENISINIKRINKRIKESKRLGWIILLAFANKLIGKPVIKMISEKDFDMDQPVFRIKYLPSYAFLFSLLRYDSALPNFSVYRTWCGFSTGILYYDKQKTNIESVMSTTQYRYLMNLKGIFDNNINNRNDKILRLLDNNTKLSDVTEKPLFPIDFLIMNEDHATIYEIIEENCKILRSSQLCYLLQTDLKLTLDMLRVNINVYQKYHGLTPLHIAALDGSFELVVVYLELGFDPNEQDFYGNTPLHYAAMNSNFACYDYMTKKCCADTNHYNFDPALTDIKNISGMPPSAYLLNYKSEIPIAQPSFVISLFKEARGDAITKSKFKIIKSRSANLTEQFKPHKDMESILGSILEPQFKIYGNVFSFIQFMQIIHENPRSVSFNQECIESMAEYFLFY